MGENVTFRGNVGELDGDLVSGPHSIIEPRLLFQIVESASEYGSNTPHPMKATMEQLLELFTGVKDAWFTSGSAVADVASIPVTFDVVPYDPPPNLHAVAGDPLLIYEYENQRGYCITSGAAPPPEYAHLFGAPYATDDGLARLAYDVTDYESAMWLFSSEYNPDFTFNRQPVAPGVYLLQSATTAFTQYGFEYYNFRYTYPDVYGITFTEGGGHIDGFYDVNFSRVVKVVDNDGSGDPYSPANDLYVGINAQMYANSSLTTYGPTTITTYFPAEEDDDLVHVESAPMKLKLVLRSGTLECDLYGVFTNGPGGDAHPYPATFTSGSDFVLTAKKWWPYRKHGGGDMYDTATGAPL